VLRVINDAGKTYGTVYYWFMFTTAGGYISTALSWNATSDIPSGTQYLDYYSTATNTVANHRQFFSATSTTTATLTRYTSAINTNCTWFLGRNGTNFCRFLIPFGTYNATSFIDQNKMAFNGAIQSVGGSYGSYGAQIYCTPFAGHLRRTYLGSVFTRGTAADTATYAGSIFPSFCLYMVTGNLTGNGAANYSGASPGTVLPTALVNTNSSLAADYTPVVTSILASPYLPVLPSDFGMAPYYASNTFATQDTLVVTASSEEWEMITVANNGVSADSGKMMFLARTV
jgi:hypothetical protein